MAMVASACGGDDAAPASSAPATEITVSEYDGERLVEARTLDCAPADAVCTRVLDLLPELPPDPEQVCAQVYGGPQRYVVDGTVAGDPVEIEVTRTDGCAIERFDRLREALGDPPPGP